MRPGLLVLAVGNPSRGDDALGPRLIDRLGETELEAQGNVELLTDFQLQVEHAIDLEGRQAVLFVDAARPGVARGVELSPLQPSERLGARSHALTAAEVLQIALQLHDRAPTAWQLALEGECFELGADLSALAQHHLEQAVALVLEWVQAQRAAGSEIVRAAPMPGAPESVRTAPAPAGDG